MLFYYSQPERKEKKLRSSSTCELSSSSQKGGEIQKIVNKKMRKKFEFSYKNYLETSFFRPRASELTEKTV